MKSRRRYTSKSRTPSRRWHIPPPLIHGTETLEGGSILQEWGSEIGVLLWQASRDVTLWATTEPEARDQLFSARPDVLVEQQRERLLEGQDDPRLLVGLRTLGQLSNGAAGMRDDQVARACRQLSEWCDDHGRLGSALAFAQSAALAARGDATAAFWVATIAGRLNDHARAEAWFRRAVGLARQSRDWRMYSRAFGGLGNLYIRRGNLPAARRLHTRALRGARRGGMRREQAAALHDLFAVAVESGNSAEAERFARLALEAYGTRNRRVHVLAHDVAYFWMDHGHFTRALPVFQAVLPLIDRPVERLFVLANVVRAAGGIGDAAIAESTAAEVDGLIGESELEQGIARAMLEVARGFLSLGQLERAGTAAQHAIDSAAAFRESKVRFAAEALLNEISERSVALPATRAATAGAETSTADQLAADFVRTLEVIAGAAP